MWLPLVKTVNLVDKSKSKHLPFRVSNFVYTAIKQMTFKASVVSVLNKFGFSCRISPLGLSIPVLFESTVVMPTNTATPTGNRNTDRVRNKRRKKTK